MNGKSILITVGKEKKKKKFAEHLLKKYKNIKRLVIYSRDELKQSEMAINFNEKKFKSIRYFIGDVRDYQRLSRAMNGIDTIIHAAALKQVPAAEYNPFEFVKTNVLGAQNIIESALDNNIKQVIALSTDKAAAPINLYGATKLCSDKLFVAADNYAGQRCKFSVVRYGNVFGSRGSVVPLFLKLSNSGLFPITSKEMTRFNISLNESVACVIKVAGLAKGGEIFVPKMSSYNLKDLANAIAPNVKKKIIGLRPGEKIHEELVGKHESGNTFDFGKSYVIINSYNSKLFNYYKSLKNSLKVKPNFIYTSDNNPNRLSLSQIKKKILYKNEI